MCVNYNDNDNRLKFVVGHVLQLEPFEKLEFKYPDLISDAEKITVIFLQISILFVRGLKWVKHAHLNGAENHKFEKKGYQKKN